MNTLNDLPLVAAALQALAPGVNIEPKVTEHCHICGRARTRLDFKWNLVQTTPDLASCRPICNECEWQLLEEQEERESL